MSRLSERIENFNNAYRMYDLAHSAYTNDKKNDINRLAIVQAFEVVFELGWKVIKDYLAIQGIEKYTPRDVIKSAFSANILPNAQIWIDMSNDRNSSSHEYNQDKVNIILDKISTEYYDEISRFKQGLEDFHE